MWPGGVPVCQVKRCLTQSDVCSNFIFTYKLILFQCQTDSETNSMFSSSFTKLFLFYPKAQKLMQQEKHLNFVVPHPDNFRKPEPVLWFLYLCFKLQLSCFTHHWLTNRLHRIISVWPLQQAYVNICFCLV